jgi:biopolymer transport protein ExbD
MSHSKTKNAPIIDLLPMMNLMAILFPFLLSVSVFQKMGIVEVNMPERSPVDMNQEAPPPDDQKLNLTIAVTQSYVTVWARGGELPRMFTKEMLTYRCKEDTAYIEVDPVVQKSKGPVKCLSGAEATMGDIDQIHMYFLDRKAENDPGRLVPAVYTETDSLMMRDPGFPDKDNTLPSLFASKSELSAGQSVMTLEPDRVQTMSTKHGHELKKGQLSIGATKESFLRVTDVLSWKMQSIHKRFAEMEDADNIIIVADDNVQFDKIIQVMDAARGAGFWNIQLAKLGG